MLRRASYSCVVHNLGANYNNVVSTMCQLSLSSQWLHQTTQLNTILNSLQTKVISAVKCTGYMVPCSSKACQHLMMVMNVVVSEWPPLLHGTFSGSKILWWPFPLWSHVQFLNPDLENMQQKGTRAKVAPGTEHSSRWAVFTDLGPLDRHSLTFI